MIDRSGDKSLGYYVRFTRRYLLLIIAMIMAGGVAGAVVSLWQPMSYNSTVLIQTVPIPANINLDGTSGRLRTIDTDAQLLTSDSVLEAAESADHVDESADTLRTHLTVSAVPRTRVLVLTVEDSQAARADATADAIAKAFISQRSEGLAAQQNVVVKILATKIDSLQTQFRDTLQSSEPKTTGAPLPADVVSTQLRILLAHLDKANSLALPADTVIHAKSAVGTGGRHPDMRRNIATGLAGGLVVGCGIGTFIDMVRLRRRYSPGFSPRWVGPLLVSS